MQVSPFVKRSRSRFTFQYLVRLIPLLNYRPDEAPKSDNREFTLKHLRVMVPWRFRARVRTRTWVWSRRRWRARSSRRMRTRARARPWMISPRTPSLAWTPASPVSSGIEEAQNWIHSKNTYGNSVAVMIGTQKVVDSKSKQNSEGNNKKTINDTHYINQHLVNVCPQWNVKTNQAMDKIWHQYPERQPKDHDGSRKINH